ncbi:MAG: LamG domain-containing protein [Ferruginibacter sp.]|nr:LamG domain-containing protein [Ferruginibacter sp.]
MKKRFYCPKNAAVVLFLATLSFSACTTVERDDAFTKGDPPPVDGGFVNSSEIAKTDLVGYWAFNGSFIDSATGVSAVNQGATFTPGKKGQAYQGSSTAYATFAPSAALQTLKSYTVAFWINSPVNTGAIGIFTIARTDDFWGNLDIYQDNGGSADKAVFKVHMYNSAVPWGGQFTDARVNFGSWIHLTATYNAATSVFNIYQNGSAIGVNSAANPAGKIGPTLHGSDPGAPPETPYGNLTFINATKMAFGAFQFQTNPSLTNGASAQGWATNFAGKLDEFRIYKRALTGQEVSALFQLEKQGR